MRFIYACYGKAGLDCLYELLNQKECAPGDILAVTYDDESNGTLLEHLRALGIRYKTGPINSAEVVEAIKGFSPDFLFSIYFRDIIGVEVLGLVRSASVNLHPSLLPDYKGCFSAPWAIINGEKRTGITYHIMAAGVDTGDILVQREISIGEEETAFSLYHRLVALGGRTFGEMFDLVARRGYRGSAQPPGGRRYRRGVPHEGFFKLEDGKDRIYRFIRAMYFPPHGGAKLAYNGAVHEFRTPIEFDAFCRENEIAL